MSLVFLLSLIPLILLNMIYLLASNILPQVILALYGLVFFALFGATVLIDPYMFVFFRGNLRALLIFNKNGLLISDISVAGEFDASLSLLSNFIVAISNFGSELIFGKQNLEEIKMQKESIILFTYEDIYAALVGNNIKEDIEGLVLNFLKLFYDTFIDQIRGEFVIVPDKDKVYNIFFKELGKAIL